MSTVSNIMIILIVIVKTINQQVERAIMDLLLQISLNNLIYKTYGQVYKRNMTMLGADLVQKHHNHLHEEFTQEYDHLIISNSALWQLRVPGMKEPGQKANLLTEGILIY
uniref:Putative secreted protein n=1 Tax=Xenopsylla cheopis TaxID=163159 RepID=A0A6M2E2D8_XENCH